MTEQSAPTVSNKLSPGRKNIKTKAVSANIIKKRIA
jgi:hypothetical protein